MESGRGGTTVTLDIRDTVARMEAAGFINSADLMNMKLTSQILVGGELYGRGLVEAEVREYSLLGTTAMQPPQAVVPAAVVPAAVVPATMNNSQLPAGFYQHSNGSKFYSDGSTAYCWFLGAPQDNSTLLATSTNPVAAGLRDDGRCGWDLPQGQATMNSGAGTVSSGTPSQLPAGHYFYQGNNAKFYTNGIDAFCWFSGSPPNGAAVVGTQQEPNATGLRNDGRCGWDR